MTQPNPLYGTRRRNSVPRVAAAIAYAELNRGDNWADPPELWGDLDDSVRREYRKMARAAIDAMELPEDN